MADIMQEIEDAADRVSRGIDALKEENAGLRTELRQFVAFHEAFAEECSKKIEAAERTIEQLRAELEYERGKG